MKITIDGQSVLSPTSSEKTEAASQWSPGRAIHGYRFHLHVRAKGDYDFIQDKLLGLHGFAGRVRGNRCEHTCSLVPRL